MNTLNRYEIFHDDRLVSVIDGKSGKQALGLFAIQKCKPSCKFRLQKTGKDWILLTESGQFYRAVKTASIRMQLTVLHPASDRVQIIGEDGTRLYHCSESEAVKQYLSASMDLHTISTHPHKRLSSHSHAYWDEIEKAHELYACI